MKLALVCELENKSTREINVILASKLTKPQARFRDSLKIKPGGISQLKVHLESETAENLEHLKAIWSNAMPDASYSEIVQRMIDESLECVDPLKKAERAAKRAERKAAKTPAPELTASSESSALEINNMQKDKPTAVDALPTQRANANSDLEVRSGETWKFQTNSNGVPTAAASESAIQSEGVMRLHQFNPSRATGSPAFIKNSVWFRDGGRCTFVDPVTGAQCGSLHFLEMDHIVPKAMGGEDSIENLRLRCRAHNQRHAINSYGLEKMRAYFAASRRH